MPRFRVQYARVVVMETTVDAQDEDHVLDDGSLPGGYEGLEPPPHVLDVMDYEPIWEIAPEEEPVA